MMRTTWGRMMRRMVWPRDKPSASDDFGLATRDGGQTCPDDLRDIGAAVAAERQDAGGERRQLHAERGKSEIDDEDLDQRRRAADEPDVEVAAWRKAATLLARASAATRPQIQLTTMMNMVRTSTSQAAWRKPGT